MIEHLPEKTINLLAQNELSGKVYVEALEHIDVCEACRKKMPLSSRATVLEILMDIPDNELKNIDILPRIHGAIALNNFTTQEPK